MLSSNFRIRTFLIVIIVLGIAGALIAERRFIRDRKQTGTRNTNTTRVRTRQTKAAAANPSFHGEGEAAQLDHFTYRNLVDLPGPRMPDTQSPLIVPRRPLETRRRGESTSNAIEMEQPFVAAEDGALFRTAVFPARSAFQRDRDQDQVRESGRRQNEVTSQHPWDDKTPRKPKEERLIKAHDFNGDLRTLPYKRPV